MNWGPRAEAREVGRERPPHVYSTPIMPWRRPLPWFALVLMLASGAAAQPRPLQPGDPAPPFTLAASDGRTYSLSDFLGVRPVVVAWFPKTFATR